ncbi:MAG: hypothetical protein EPO13_01245 [Actinomycetota bacterium]|nr:MAG: hypothetical protein EPO13_01245 [Actinomycetota bacterium]
MPGRSRVFPEHHHGHRDVTGGSLRPAVFGFSDGLVSNVALMAGVAGGAAAAGADPSAVLIAGLAGLVAGSFSMAAGEFVSVSSQSELAAAEIEAERRELSRSPEAEAAELARLWESRGLDRATAEQVARQISRDPKTALEVHAREEIGLVEAELPSAWRAAWSSLAAFAVGAMVPLLPYLLGARALAISLACSAVAAFGAGVLVSRLTVRSWWFGGLRQLLVSAAAAGVTYAVGALIGSAVG